MIREEHVYPGLRLAPIDRPPNMLQRFARWYFARSFGKVMMPLRVLYPRSPGLFRAMLGMYRYLESGLALDPELKHLLQVHVSRSNGCTFCTDLHRAAALRDDCAEVALQTPDDTSARLGPAARAALRYADEMREHGTVSDQTFSDLRRHFSERQVVEIVWLYAFTTYTNLMAKPLGMESDGFCELAQARRLRPRPRPPAATSPSISG